MSKAQRSKQIENEVRTRIATTMQEVREELQSWMESFECRLCNNLNISLKDGVDDIRKDCNLAGTLLRLHKGINPTKLLQQKVNKKELQNLFPSTSWSM